MSGRTPGPAGGQEASLGPNAALVGRAGGRRSLATPALVLDLDALEHNLALMADRARQAGLALRPHAKGTKSVEIARRQVALGAVGVCCATLREVAVMRSGGVRDVLLTAPQAGEAAVARLATLAADGPGLAAVVDGADAARALSRAVAAAGAELRTLVEADAGQGRTGVRGPAAAVELARLVAALPGLRYGGVQVYWGHLQHVATSTERRAKVEAQAVRLRAVVKALTGAGLAPRTVTGGGTGTFAIDASLGLLTEIQAGSYAVLDRQYLAVDLSHPDGRHLRPALTVAATVTSANDLGAVIVDAGLKAFATEAGPPSPADLALSGASYHFMGDEHGRLDAPDGTPLPAPGAVLELLPPHCDPTINLYDRYHVVRGDVLVGIWAVDARGYD